MNKLFLLITLIVMSSIDAKAQTKSRSAKTGKYVSKNYATKHKSTTYTSSTKPRKSRSKN